MQQAKQIITSTQLRQFAPLGKLSDDDAQELLRTSITVQLSPGTPLFSNGNNSNQFFYLIKGKIELHSSNKTVIIESGENEARKPIGRHSDKHATAVALAESTLVSFDADMLDLFLNWTNPNAYVVSEVEGGQDNVWLSRLLKSRGLLRFSEQQINTLIDRMNEVHFNKGDVVISQDDNDEFYYVIKKGSVTVSRKPSAAAKEIKLAELSEGEAFGEESILTKSNRGATITMNESGDLMRLSKQDFSELLSQPLLETISWNETQAMVATGAEFIDIRLEEEFIELHVPGSRNIPLPLLRLRLKKLNQHRKYIICCNDGSRSSVAAFILNRHGFNAVILDGGMTTVISQMADYEMDKFAAEAESQPSEAAIDTNEHGNQFCSLAEHWGNTIEKPDGDGFSDNKALHNIEKTTVTKGTIQTVAITEQKQAKQKLSPVESDSFQINNNNTRSSKLFRKLLTTITITILAAAATMYYFSTNYTDTESLISNSLSPDIEEIVEPSTAIMGASKIASPISPMTNFVEPDTNSTENEATTELVGDADIYPTDSEILQLQPDILTTPTLPAAVDPATRGFIE